MRSRTGNSLSTLMFMVPLLGVPLMAVFGVPQFVPVIASSVSNETARPVKTSFKSSVGESASASSFAADRIASRSDSQDERPFQDLFRPTKRPRRDSRPIRDGEAFGREAKFVETSLNAETWLTQTSSERSTSETNRNLNDLFGNVADTERFEPSLRPREAADQPDNESKSSRSPATLLASNVERSSEGLTWREAVRRLNELGIQEFRLEPGRELGEFYFACEFTPHRDARVTRRFEAEAKEPLLAVQAVLRQIDEWQTRR